VQVRKVELEAANVKPNTHEKDKEDQEYAEMMPWDSQGCLERMEHINQLVKDVSHFTQSPKKNTLFLIIYDFGVFFFPFDWAYSNKDTTQFY